MPTPQEEFQNAVLRILETVMFENWIRFYFLTEKLDAPVEEGAEKPLFVAIPEQGMQRIKELVKTLPGLDCGCCGAPTCSALAEDVVQGYASEEDCIFRMRERMQYLSGTGDADEYLPAPFRCREDETERRSAGNDQETGKEAVQ